MGSGCDGIQTGEVVGTPGGKDRNPVRGLREPVRLLSFELSRRGNPPNLPFSMSGSLSPRECGVVSAGGLRKPAVFTFNHTELEYSFSHISQPHRDPGVLGHPCPGIRLFHSGRQEYSNGPAWDSGSHRYWGGR